MQKHNQLVEMIAADLIDRGYRDVRTFEEYKNRKCGEIDLYVPLENYVLLFEVKERDSIRNYNKAVKQTFRAAVNCFPDKRVFRFYAYGVDNGYRIEYIRRRH